MKILLVDGSESSRRMLRPVLAALGGSVVDECARGADALTLAEAGKPDLLVIAGQPPDMDALDVVRGFRRIDPDTPAVLLAEDGSRARVIQAIKAGADNYLTIPWTPDLVHQRIGETMARAASTGA